MHQHKVSLFILFPFDKLEIERRIMEKNQEKGIFKFSIIAPLVNKTHGFDTTEDYLSFASSKTYSFDGVERKYSKSCIRSWYTKYLKYGIQGLEGKTRKDFKTSRKLSSEAIRRIEELRKQYPKITGVAIYKKLIEESYIFQKDVSLSTIHRYLKKNHLKAEENCTVERRMFEMEHVNDCWQADTSYGPYLKVGGKKYRTYIIMFIDDKSRMIMGFDVFLEDTAIHMQQVFKNAIKTYGKPKRLFVDNGGPYDNKQLSYICATIGVELIHAKPYTPEAKAKQERLFRTIKDGWMNCTNWNDFQSLEDVRNSLATFLYKEYINQKHSVTKETPNERWHQEFQNITYLEETFIEESFLHREQHKVRNDRTIKFKNEFYEVPFEYVGKTIETRYDPTNLEILYLYEENKMICEIKKVDKVANSKSKRKNRIDYSLAINDERDVIESEE